jgi:hypothetical protein
MQDVDIVDSTQLDDVYAKKSAAPKPERQINTSEKLTNLKRRCDCRQDSSLEH